MQFKLNNKRTCDDYVGANQAPFHGLSLVQVARLDVVFDSEIRKSTILKYKFKSNYLDVSCVVILSKIKKYFSLVQICPGNNFLLPILNSYKWKRDKFYNNNWCAL